MKLHYTTAFLFMLLLMSTLPVVAQYGPLERITPSSPHVVDTQVEDIDGDGDMDVVAVSRSNGAVVWYENDGNGNFPHHHHVFSFTEDSRNLALLDLNSDDAIDILLGKGLNTGEEAIVLINDGSGSFTDNTSAFQVLQWVIDPVAIEMNADGELDVLDGLLWYENLGNGLFSTSNLLPIPANTELQRVADVNGDGLPEVFYEINYNTFGYLYNDSASVNFTEIVFPDELEQDIHAIGDFDGDGDKDLLTQSFVVGATDHYAWYENDGTGHFPHFHLLIEDQHFMSAFPELVAVNLDQTPNDEIFSYHYDDVVFTFADSMFTGPAPLAAFGQGGSYNGPFADFNGDGALDFLIDRGLTVILNNGSSSGWTETSILDNPTSSKYFELADMNGDGFEDIVTSSYRSFATIDVLHYLGNGEYAEKSELVSNNHYWSREIYVDDYNTDGALDIGTFKGLNNSFQYFLNQSGTGFNQLTVIEDSINYSVANVSADFDGDGDQDVVEVFPYGQMVGYFLYRNNGAGYDIETISNEIASIETYAKTVDIEGDGDTDIIYLVRGTGNADGAGISVLTNDGSGIFEYQMVLDVVDQYSYQHMDIADLDGDGDMDVLVTSFSTEPVVTIFEYDFDRYVQHSVNVDPDLLPHTSLISDVDNDGQPDLVCFTRDILDDGGSGLFWYRNLDSLHFEGPYFQSYTEPYMTEVNSTVVRLTYQMQGLDRDNDGDEDLFISDYGSGAAGGIYYLENLYWGSYRITGHVFFDADTSADLTTGDYPFQFASVDIAPSQSAFFTSPDGSYNAIVNDGAMTVTPDLDTSLWTISTPYSTYTVTLDSANPVINGIDFGVIPNGVQPNAIINLTAPAGVCNTLGVMWVSVQNTGNTILSGVVAVTLDSILTPVAQSSSADSIVANTFYFTLDSLHYFDLKQWLIEVDLPGVTQIGSQFDNYGTYNDISGLTVNDSTTDIVVCAYDPNDKVETTGIGEEGLISNGQWLEYTVRFQNTGNYFATDVTVRDQLSEHLDQSSLTPISWSHDVVTSIEPDGEVVFFFENILLPDSGADYTGSQGFVTYIIKADSNLYPGTEILNVARIFFDQNPPIVTNATLNTVECYGLSEQPIEWDGNRFRSPFILPDEQQWYLNGNPIAGANSTSFTPLIDGTYHVEAIYFDNCPVSSSQYIFEGTGIEEGEQNSAVIYPNPNSGRFQVQFAYPPEKRDQLVITDMIGREVYREPNINSGLVSVNSESFNAGVFLLYLQQENQRQYLGGVILLTQ